MNVMGVDLTPDESLAWPQYDWAADLAVVIVRLRCRVGGVNSEP